MKSSPVPRFAFLSALAVLVSQSLFAGLLPSAQTRLEYVESAGEQYVDTEVKFAADQSLVVESDVAIMALDPLGTSDNLSCFLGATDSKRILPIAMFGKGWSLGTCYFSFNAWSPDYRLCATWATGQRTHVRAEIAPGSQSFVANGRTHYAEAAETISSTGDYSFYLFANNEKGTATHFIKARCYSMKIWISGTLVRDFVPCRRDSDRAVGFYDCVSSNFFANAGGGELVAGPDYREITGRLVGAEGGVVTKFGDDNIHTFTTNGTLTVRGEGRVDVLVVGGGGGGGNSYAGGGGGGGGGVLYEQGFPVTAGVYQVTVGLGGKGAPGGSDSALGGNGGVSSVFGLVAQGGGGGGRSTEPGLNGASGGGAGLWYQNKLSTRDPSWCVVGQGYPSGGSQIQAANQGYGGGGGGAGAPGTTGTVSPEQYGNGGDGFPCPITGTEVYYGGGGGGGMSIAWNKWSEGGNGGGGRGGSRKDATTNNAGENGKDGLGGGGGAGGHIGGTMHPGSGSGGSGIVIVRYTPRTDEYFEFVETTGATKSRCRTEDGTSWDVYTFTGEGTFTVPNNSVIDVLLVGGGGGGGAGYAGGGGGGAGGVIHMTNVLVTADTYRISVGGGGLGGRANANKDLGSSSTSGTNTTAFGFVAKGGGRGGDTNEGGGSGGSGGGGAAFNSNETFKRIGGGGRTEGQGNYAGRGVNTNAWGKACAGGGGGAGAGGHDGDPSVALGQSGQGGDGILCSITGTPEYYGGGGGGGTSFYAAWTDKGSVPGGLGGGGRGGARYTADKPMIGTPGTPGTGGGGGGGGGYSPNLADGGNGGSGIVIVRCRRKPTGALIILR